MLGITTLGSGGLLALAGGVVPLAGVKPSLSQGPSGTAPRTTQTTALLVTATNTPWPVMGSDGMAHLAYDLIVTNTTAAPVRLTGIEVLAPDGGVLLRLAGETLAARTGPINGGEPTDQVPAGGVVATQIDCVVPPDQVPGQVRPRLSYDLPADAPGRGLITSQVIEGPHLASDTRPPLVIAPPLRGGGWLSSNPGFHRASTSVVNGAHYRKPELFAIDWTRIEEGRPFLGDASRPERWFGFGHDVLAVGEGTVVFVRDGLPEGTPGQRATTLEQAVEYAGNHVVLQLQPDVWAVYAHLQLGSVRVQVGERVRTGQPLGRVGNSGNSLAPHLHFQLSDTSPTERAGAIVAANSLPFVLDRYTLRGMVEPQAFLALFTRFASPSTTLADADATLEPSGMSPPQPQAGTYPLELTVVDFL